MYDILKLALSFALMVFLIRRKLKVGHVMTMGAAALWVLYLLAPRDAGSAVLDTLKNPVTIELILALSLIRMLEMTLREQGLLTRMMNSFKRSFASRRAVIISMPMLIGMLPSVGGAYFSAPMVDEATRDEDMPPDEKAFVNYWFRHPWEFVLPLYPGILLASALGGVELRTLMLYNLAPMLLMFCLGFIFSMRSVKKNEAGGGLSSLDLKSFIPVVLVLVMVIAFQIRLYVALGIVVAGLSIFFRYGPSRLWKLVRHGFSLDVALLIFGVVLFKESMEATGAVGNISTFFAESGVPLMPTLVMLPFMAGILTGITIGYVGATFPLIAGLAGGDAAAAQSLAFVAGFAGVMLSPVHVCLILTREYFSADMQGIYRRMWMPLLAVVLASSVIYFFIQS